MAKRDRTPLQKSASHPVSRHGAARRLEEVDCICAGVPCQDVSVAGKRAGLAGERTGLFYEFARILRELRPTWFVFENVPGLLSSNNGRDFAEIQRVLMVECGYGVCWRVLNSQFFGVAQRRRRVFIVGRFGKPCPAEVLFEPEGSRRNIAQGSKTGKDIAVPLTSGVGVTSNHPGRRQEDDFILATLSSHNQAEQSYRGDGCDPIIVQQAISAKWSKGSSGPAGAEHRNLTVCIQDARGQRDKQREGGPMYTLDGTSQHAVASLSGMGSGGPDDNDAQANRIVSAPADSHGMRDFTGLPEGMDSARYRALGNAVTVSVARWILRNIRKVEEKQS